MSKLKILCPFCNAPYTAEMVMQLIGGFGCDTCGYGCEPSGVLTINCKKIVYEKEY